MMLRRLLLGLIVGLLAASPASALTLAVKQVLGPPGWVLPYNPDLQFDFARGTAWKGTGSGGGAVVPSSSLLTVARASNATDLLPTSTAGFPYATFVSNQPVRSPNLGLLVFEARTNLLLNSTAPATQTTGSLANGTYTLWVNGSGSATMSAGTATGCGTGVATQGTPVNFTTTGAAGTCTVTVAGSLNAFQLELGTFGTPLIVTAGVTATRAADAVTVTNAPAVPRDAMALYASGTPTAPVTYGAQQEIVSVFADGATIDRVDVRRRQTTGVAEYATRVANVATASATLGTWTQSVRGKVAISFIGGRQAGTFNAGAIGTTASTISSYAVPGMSIGGIGVAGSPWDGIVDGVAYFSGIRADATLRDMVR